MKHRLLFLMYFAPILVAAVNAKSTEIIHRHELFNTMGICNQSSYIFFPHHQPIKGEPQQKTSYFPNEGLKFSFNDGAYKFGLSGFIQPSIKNVKYDSALGGGNDNLLSAKRAYFMLSGEAKQEKVSFLIQTNFSDQKPLLDAWVAYHPKENLVLTFGQKQTFVNNREMLFREDRLQMTDRALMSGMLSESGREFGVFAEAFYGKKFCVSPKLAITSGDGRNSFGADSRDSDIGGLKYGGRLDVYPLGYFTEGNQFCGADLKHEKRPVVVLGSAFSLNRGASSAVGEGHGDFFIYDKRGTIAMSNYRKLYFDILAKYRGFSMMLEYGNATASGLGENYINSNATVLLAPQQISNYLMLGNSYNAQLGYTTQSGYSIDLRYGQCKPEFADNPAGAMSDMNEFTLGLTQYLRENNLKFQLAYTLRELGNGERTRIIEVMSQFAF